MIRLSLLYLILLTYWALLLQIYQHLLQIYIYIYDICLSIYLSIHYLYIYICIYIYMYIYIHIYLYYIHIYIYDVRLHHVSKCMSCHKAIVVITGRAHCFHDNIYITLILLLWDLSTLCVVDHLWPLIYIYIYMNQLFATFQTQVSTALWVT